MAHNFSNLGKIHSCLNFIAWYYWIIKHNYFLKLEWGFPAPFPALPSRLQRQRGKGRGSQYFAWAQAHVALFLLDCIIGPCRQRLISHCEFPTKVPWVRGGGGWNQRRNCFQVPPGLPWLWGRPRGGSSRSKGFGSAQTGFELSCLLATFPGAGGLLSRLQFALL